MRKKLFETVTDCLKTLTDSETGEKVVKHIDLWRLPLPNPVTKPHFQHQLYLLNSYQLPGKHFAETNKRVKCSYACT